MQKKAIELNRKRIVMNFSVILSGGTGTRMRNDGFPKQYIEVSGKPILMHTVTVFEQSKDVDAIVVVAASEWNNKIKEWMKEFKINKFAGIAPAGKSRQESVYNGFKYCADIHCDSQDIVILHEAVRPLVSLELIHSIQTSAKNSDVVMPVLPMSDTIYQSVDGKKVTHLLDRSTLYAGQSPEVFYLKKFLEIQEKIPKEEMIKYRGASELAFRYGLQVTFVKGDDMNFKLTTPADLNRYLSLIRNKK